MTLDQLEMIEAIIQEGSYQAAARKIHKSQPSLTNGVKKIEEYYGIEIFSRAGYRPVLTDVGKRFFENAKLTLESYRKLDELATILGTGVEPEIRISMDPIVNASEINKLFNILHDHPQTNLRLESGILFDNAEKLVSGEVDFAIGHYPLIDNELIEKRRLCTIELIPVINRQLAGSKLTQDRLSKIPNIVVKTQNESSAEVSDMTIMRWSVDSHIRKEELIKQGVGWGRLSKAAMIPSLKMISPKLVEPISLEIFFMRHLNKTYGPVGEKIWESLV